MVDGTPPETTSTTADDLSSSTLGPSIRDQQTVTPKGDSVERRIDGVKLYPVVTHVDDRGSLVEMFDPRWGLDEPIVSAYCFTVRAGHAKGWAMHKAHHDRYFVLQGEAEIVLYDDRPESPTCGQLNQIQVSGFNRCLLSFPSHVWHATVNLGSIDMIAVNFPTILYDHASPDKYRLPLDTPLIPFSFKGTPGW